ncbi:ficolin-1-like [Calliphora vicina]|uniref:ficolin-1-like n=1 Tax=Calliphora vicina TaxID=7373 RepID=UPI00325BDAE3
MDLYLWLLVFNVLIVKGIENPLGDDNDNNTELLAQLMQLINSNQNLTLHVLNMNERLIKLETKTLKYEENINQFKQFMKDQQNVTPTDLSCVNVKDSEWIVIQRRQDGSVDFYRNWNEYKVGFGNKDGEFFIGLETLHRLTDSGVTYELLVEMETFGGSKHNASYSHFVVGSESENYKLKNLGRFRGNAGDSLNYHLHQWFSTKDRRNDQNPVGDCAQTFEGGWWYNECHQSNLNGRYYHVENTPTANGIHWYRITYYTSSLKFVEMKIRARSCRRN